MSRLLLIVMIVLLPLRAWAGDLMSVQMATSGLASSAMPPDCPMLAHADAAPAADDASQPQSGMPGCSSCDLCLPVAELANARFDTVSVVAHAEPQTGGVDFVSASPAPALKPPIS